ncbi:hypothetical protein DRP05_14040 [Archaeoglobales archaeon]|nr:MAG: hypothetical protein DRP05_14040 [Archaeoglobales archaeon]
MSEKVLTKTTAELYKDGWVKAELTLTDESITIGTEKVTIREIEDLELVEVDSSQAIRIKKGGDIVFRVPGKLQSQIFRFLAFNLKSDRFAVYFLSPATRGGVVVTNVKWEKGYLSITDEAVWFLSPNKQLRISFDNLGSVDKDVRTVGGKQRVVLVIAHVEKGEVLTSLVLCPETTLEMLEHYLKQLIEKYKPKSELSDVEIQIATLIYSGVDSVSIESILGISTDELDKYFDKLVDLGLARVVKIRKELELTPKGVAVVSEAQKSQNIMR